MERYERITSTRNLTSSTSIDTNIQEHIPEISTHLSVTTVLNYCKSKILNPYLRFLSFVGLRPLIAEQQEPSFRLKLLSSAYFAQSVLLIIIGYVLQYMACYRRDRGFCYAEKSDDLMQAEEVSLVHEQTCDNSLLFSFVIPSVLHLAGYLHAVIATRTVDDEQMPVLMERVFILSTHLSNGYVGQKKLVRTLWIFIIFSVIWMVSSFALVNYMMAEGDVYFKWMMLRPPWTVTILKGLLLICTLWHDIVQATIISNYCLQAQLLISYAQFLRDRLLQCTIQPLEWMREIEDFKKLLNHFNGKIAPSVCLLNIVNITFTISGMLWVFHFREIDPQTLPVFTLSIVNVFLWFLISVAPFVQAARLSNACDILKAVGQEARARPYVHLDTPTTELDSILLYTTSLKSNAQLYCVPITGKNLCLLSAIAAVVILVLGQCHYLYPNFLIVSSTR